MLQKLCVSTLTALLEYTAVLLEYDVLNICNMITAPLIRICKIWWDQTPPTPPFELYSCSYVKKSILFDYTIETLVHTTTTVESC